MAPKDLCLSFIASRAAFACMAPLLNDGQVTHAVHIQFKNRLVSEDHLKTAVLEDFIVEDESLL